MENLSGQDQVIMTQGSYILPLEKCKDVVQQDNQPLLCTYVKKKENKKNDNIMLYKPRSKLIASVICLFGYGCTYTVNTINITQC